MLLSIDSQVSIDPLRLRAVHESREAIRFVISPPISATFNSHLRPFIDLLIGIISVIFCRRLEHSGRRIEYRFSQFSQSTTGRQEAAGTEEQ